LISAALFVFVVAQVAVADNSAGPGATSSASVKKLTKQVKALKKRVAALEARPDKVGQVPATLPPSGSAGGVLSGTYPNPSFGDGVVTGGSGGPVLDGSLTSDDLAPSAVTSTQILDGTVTAGDLAPRQDLINPTLSNCATGVPWTNGPAFARDVSYWKDLFGVVHLEGAVGCTANATEGVALFQLPAGYRPPFSTGDVLRFGALGSGAALVQLAILGDGSGALVFDGPDSDTVDNYISLDGITFRAQP